MQKHKYFVYIVSNKSKTTIYTGVTNDLERRLMEHYDQKGNLKTFAGRYNTCYLIYFETYRYIRDAIAREKKLKAGEEKKKLT